MLEEKLSRKPEMFEIAIEVELPIEAVRQILDSGSDTLSLDSPISTEENASFIDFLEDKRSLQDDLSSHSSLQTTINVADGVTFIATANIGNEYTSTRVMDKALMDRFTIIEMDLLDKSEEAELLHYMFPLVEIKHLENIAGITDLTRKECNNEESRLSAPVSTRTSVEIASLIYDGFTLQEAADITIYPQYSTDGGVDSERTFIKQIVQKFCDDGTEEDLFNIEDTTDGEGDYHHAV